MTDFKNINFSDNSGYSPSVVSIPALTSSTKFKIGTTQIKIGATDLSGNTRKCAFTVTVKGNQKYKQHLFRLSINNSMYVQLCVRGS